MVVADIERQVEEDKGKLPEPEGEPLLIEALRGRNRITAQIVPRESA